VKRKPESGPAQQPYDRVADRWECGRTAAPCSRGPGAKGECSGGAACVPRQDGDRWHCARSPQRGGPCASGPGPRGECGEGSIPCIPRMTERPLRWRWAVGVLAVALAVLFLMVDRAGWRDWISAGELSSPHALFASDCSQCHDAAHVEWVDWVRLAWRNEGRNESHLCVNCHQMGPESLQPHGRTPTKASSAPPVELGCRTCHREHQGRAFDATRVPDAQCAACHEELGRGVSGHPNGLLGGGEPVVRFDHQAHHGKHFADPEYRDRAPAECHQCHTPTPDGLMSMPSYVNACGDCHDARVWGETLAGSRGIPLLGLPGLDVQTLEERGLPIGVWPSYADDRPAALLDVLQRLDPALAADYHAVAGIDWRDLRDTAPEDLERIARLAWGTKNLFFELAREGQQSLGRRLTSSGETVPRDRMAALLAGLSPSLLEAFVDDLLPGVEDELRNYYSGTFASRPPAPVNGRRPDAQQDLAQGKQVDRPGNDDLLLDGHGATAPADDLLLGGRGSASSAGDLLSGDHGSGGLGGDLLTNGREEAVDPMDDLLLGGPAASPADDLLLGGPAATPADDLLTGDTRSVDPMGGLLSGGQSAGGSMLSQGTPADTWVPPPRLRAEERTVFGGWYRDGPLIFYRPAGHADPLLRSWIEEVAHMDFPADVTRSVTDGEGPGGCRKCHIDSTGDVRWERAVDWKHRDDRTRFNHRAHLGLQNEQQCALCHELSSQEAETASGVGFPTIADCADCHRRDGAVMRCVSCHRYHGDAAP
jgi:hypothetical protein